VPIVVPSRESFTDPTSWVGTMAHKFFFRCQSTHRRRIGVVRIDYYQTYLALSRASKQWRCRWMQVRESFFLNHFHKYPPAPILILIALVMCQAALT